MQAIPLLQRISELSRKDCKEMFAKLKREQQQALERDRMDTRRREAESRQRWELIKAGNRKRKKHRRKPKQTRTYCFSLECYATRNEILRAIGFECYDAYLKSDLWHAIRARTLKTRSKCIKCGLKADEVHHSAYDEDTLRGRSNGNLHPVCRRCHEAAEFHNGKKLSLSTANRLLGITRDRNEHNQDNPRRRKRRSRRTAQAVT